MWICVNCGITSDEIDIKGTLAICFVCGEAAICEMYDEELDWAALNEQRERNQAKQIDFLKNYNGSDKMPAGTSYKQWLKKQPEWNERLSFDDLDINEISLIDLIPLTDTLEIFGTKIKVKNMYTKNSVPSQIAEMNERFLRTFVDDCFI